MSQKSFDNFLSEASSLVKIIFKSSHLPPAQDISQLKQKVQSLEDLQHKDPESFIAAHITFPVAV
jgi:hypothetical protein